MANIINSKNFDNVISKGKVLIDFYADWCGPCRMVAPAVEEISREREDITVAKVNVDLSPELAVRFGVSSIPTLIAFRDGAVVSRAVGVRTKEQITAMIDG